jgi:hypothetical protein
VRKQLGVNLLAISLVTVKENKLAIHTILKLFEELDVTKAKKNMKTLRNCPSAKEENRVDCLVSWDTSFIQLTCNRRPSGSPWISEIYIEKAPEAFWQVRKISPCRQVALTLRDLLGQCSIFREHLFMGQRNPCKWVNFSLYQTEAALQIVCLALSASPSPFN